jgi:hypothetical protein
MLSGSFFLRPRPTFEEVGLFTENALEERREGEAGGSTKNKCQSSLDLIDGN